MNVIDGPLTGSTFKLVPGLSLGRKKASINLEDAKISSIHAVLEEDEGGGWVLVDNQSRNGLFVDGKRVDHIPITDQLEVQLGRSLLQFVLKEVSENVDFSQLNESWRDTLGKFNQDLAYQHRPALKKLQALTPVVELEFIQGPQLSTRWTLGYGPRWIGPSSLEFPLHEPLAAAEGFEVYPENERPHMRCADDQLIKLNGRPVESEALHHGDEISIGNTLIRVRFVNV